MPYDNSKGGKIRNKLFRVHAGAPKPKDTSTDTEAYYKPLAEVEETPKLFHQKEFAALTRTDFVINSDIKSNIFKNVIIKPETLKQKLPPSYSKKDQGNFKVKELKESIIKEIGQAKRKKIPFHEVVASAKDFLKKREQEKQKAATAILGDFDALEKALPALDQLIEENKKEDKTSSRASKPLAKQDAEMMEDLQTYQQVLTSSQYMSDPFGTISNQLRNRLQSGSL